MRTSKGYLGVGKQSLKGIGVSPGRFIQLSAEEAIEIAQNISVYREIEGDQLVSNILKEGHEPGGTYPFFARPDLAGAFLTYVLGKDTKTGTEPPYTHTIIHNNTIPWLTIERSLMAVERIIDCKLNSLTISSASKQFVVIEVEPFGIKPEIHAEESTPTYEANKKFRFNMGTYKIDDVEVANIVSYSIEILRNLAGDDYTTGFLRDDLQEMGFDINVEFGLKFLNSTFYKKVLYGGGADAVAELDDGQFEIDHQYGEGADLKQLKITLPSLKHLSIAGHLNPEPSILYLPCTAQAIKPAAGEIITCVVKNEFATDYDEEVVS